MTLEPAFISPANTRDAAPFFKGAGLIVPVALIAALVKTAIALTTFGTNDSIAFYQFAKALETHGLTWTYEHSALFNHPPLVGYFLQGLAWLDHQPFLQENGFTFPFLLRFPGIIADFGVVLLVLFIVREYPRLRPPRWALILFAASPVSIMVTGFHGNTDPILVLFLLLASIMAVRGQPLLCGLFLALSCQVKIIPLLLLPIFFFVWMERRRWVLFAGSFVASSLLFCAEPLLKSPAAIASNVLAYGSFWGIWGVTYCLRMTGLAEFSKVSFFNLSGMQNAIIFLLKVMVVGRHSRSGLAAPKARGPGSVRHDCLRLVDLFRLLARRRGSISGLAGPVRPPSFADVLRLPGRRQLDLSLRPLHHHVGRFPVVFRARFEQAQRHLRALGSHSMVDPGRRFVCFGLERTAPASGSSLPDFEIARTTQ